MSASVNFKEIYIRNFLSFGNNTTCIDLSDLGTTLILGQNIDTGGNNGCGKTTIINAICYAFYNKAFDNISLQRLINSTNDSKNTSMEVRIVFTKGENTYGIYRSRGEQININIKKDDLDITLDSIAENDKLVEEIIGLSYELFTKVIIFSGNSLPFLMMPVAQQRNQIEELFNITILSEKALKLKEKIKLTESDIQIKSAVIKEQEKRVSDHNEQLSSAEYRVNKWDKEKVERINNLKLQKTQLDNVDLEREKELHVVITELSNQLTPLNAECNTLTNKISSLDKSISKLASEIEHLTEAKCPYCLQHFAESNKKLEVLEQELLQKDDEVTELTPILEEKRVKYAELTSDINEAKSLIKFKTLAEVVRVETLVNSANEKILSIENESNPHIDAFNQLNSKSFNEVQYDELDDLKRTLEHQQFLLKLLTDKNSFIRKNIISKTIPFLNRQLFEYTKALGLPHLVKFDNDMSCSVSEFGRELDFGNLSSGEKKRVNFSLSLAFRDVLHHLHARVNCLFVDEIDASLDSIGVENVFKLLKQKTIEDHLSLWLISHRPEAIGRFDKTVVVRKEHGFSQILESEEVQ